MKNCLVTFLIIFGIRAVADAQTTNQINTETEAGTDGSDNFFVSQYVFYDQNTQERRLGFSALGRFTNVEKSVHRGEFGMGPNWHTKHGLLDTYIGGTTDGKLMLAAVGVAFLPHGYSFVGISDPKLPIVHYQNGVKQTTTSYRKVWVGKGWFWFRWEDLHINQFGEAFDRFGGEIRVHPKTKIELFANPFFDAKNGKTGVQGGVRVRLR